MTLGLVKAAARELRATSAVTTLVGTSTEWGPWIFRHKPYVSLEGTGSAMVVLVQRPNGAPNRHNTARFVTLQVEVYADVPRDASGHPSGRTAEEVAEDVFLAIDAVCHVAAQRPITWGDGNGRLRVVSSTRAGDLDVVDVPGGDGLVRGIVSYDVVLG